MGLAKTWSKITLAGPSTLVPRNWELRVSVSYNLNNAIENADAIMLLRIQHERQTQTFPRGIFQDVWLEDSDCKPRKKQLFFTLVNQ